MTSTNMHHLVSIVLSGGAGTRMWPVSRESHPKPFIKLDDGETLLGKTYDRIKTLGSELLTVTNQGYYFLSQEQLALSGMSGRFILEPFGRNTAPAVAIAAKYVEAYYGADTLMLVLAADHIIEDQKKFDDTVRIAADLAMDDYLVAVGVIPKTPETGFGYIERGRALGLGNKVTRFVEKPDFETAKSYIASGNYLWNTGIFCFKASVVLSELAKHAPEILNFAEVCWAQVYPLSNPQIAEIPEEYFKAVPNISLDFALFEKSGNIAVVPGNFGWDDFGTWSALQNLVKPDVNQNRAIGEATFIDSKNIFVYSESRVIATLGVDNLMIIDTPDALLVADHDKAQDVKKVVEQLKNSNPDALKIHRKVIRPWGTYTVLEEAPGFKIKRIEVKVGGSLSLQRHSHRSEHWVVVSGEAKVTNGKSEMYIHANQSTYIPAGQIHRLENSGDKPCVMIEVQCGNYLEEDDIVRFDDKYGR